MGVGGKGIRGSGGWGGGGILGARGEGRGCAEGEREGYSQNDCLALDFLLLCNSIPLGVVQTVMAA